MHDESRSALAISRALEIKPGAAKAAFPIRAWAIFTVIAGRGELKAVRNADTGVALGSFSPCAAVIERGAVGGASAAGICAVSAPAP